MKPADKRYAEKRQAARERTKEWLNDPEAQKVTAEQERTDAVPEKENEE